MVSSDPIKYFGMLNEIRLNVNDDSDNINYKTLIFESYGQSKYFEA